MGRRRTDARRRPRTQPLGVVAGGDQQLPGGVDPDPGQGHQGGRGRGDQRLELEVEPIEFGLELLPAAGQGPQAGLGRSHWASQSPRPQPRARPN
jgi:hypothetical protein